MKIWTLRSIGTGLAVAATAGALVVSTAPQANADVCANLGNQVSVSADASQPETQPVDVSGCANVGNVANVVSDTAASVVSDAAASVPLAIHPVHRPHLHLGHHGRR